MNHVATRQCLMLAILIAATGAWSAEPVDLSQSTVVSASRLPRHDKVAEMFVEEIQKRTGTNLERSSSLPTKSRPAIVLGTVNSLPSDVSLPSEAVPTEKESYALWVEPPSTVYAVGRDDRGMLFAAGRLLRWLDMGPGRLLLNPDLHVATTPRYPLRGHELGYRNKSNTYDAWSVEQYEQYIRDLAVFGANTIQLVVQLDVMDREGPHMTESVFERTLKLSELIDSYGLQVWLWLAPSEEAITPETAPAVLDKCRPLFEQCSRIDAVFVPGGDPGDTPPDVLLPMLKEMATLLRLSHPDAEVWLSNEDMSHDWNAALFDMLQNEPPAWLTGVVFGTWVKLPLREERARVPQRFRIVQYADITHSIECQYPVPGWDRAFALTLGREPINPRPVAMAHIHSLMAPYTSGFITYSDGVNDDVNKIIWTALGWNPSSTPESILEDYGNYFISPGMGHNVAVGLLSLEENWKGPVVLNTGIDKTLAHWEGLARKGGPSLLSNWRFQMALFRARYDAFVRARALHQDAVEKNALAALEQTEAADLSTCIREVLVRLAQTDDPSVGHPVREGIEASAARLFRTIGMQLSVDKYGASNWERGAVLDALDMPLNDRPWLSQTLENALASSDDAERLRRVEAVLRWEDPGRGGFYDDLGNPRRQPHLVRQRVWQEDPGGVESPQEEFIEIKGREQWRKSWLDQSQTLFGTPLLMRYDDLDPACHYSLRVTYTGRFHSTMRLTADDHYEVHPALPQPPEPEPLEFPIPREATVDGHLELRWDPVPGSGRGCQVAEVWLVRARQVE